MLTGMELMSCPNLAVPAEVMQHIVHVESSANPFAIGVVGGQLMRQPQNLAEALATVKMLDAKGYNYSLGIAQVNRANFAKYGLDSYAKAFDTCTNLSAGAHILADCYARAKGNWGDAFSCYYSGDFKTGYRDGYVQKVYTSIEKESDKPVDPSLSIPLMPEQISPQNRAAKQLPHPPPTVVAPQNYRVALRSVAIDTVANALIKGAVSRASPTTVEATGSDSSTATAMTQQSAAMPTAVDATAKAAPKPPAEAPAEPAVFVPQVQGPGDPAGQLPSTNIVANTTQSPAIDHADLRPEQHDAAFVF